MLSLYSIARFEGEGSVVLSIGSTENIERVIYNGYTLHDMMNTFFNNLLQMPVLRKIQCCIIILSSSISGTQLEK